VRRLDSSKLASTLRSQIPSSRCWKEMVDPVSAADIVSKPSSGSWPARYDSTDYERLVGAPRSVVSGGKTCNVFEDKINHVLLNDQNNIRYILTSLHQLFRLPLSLLYKANR